MESKANRSGAEAMLRHSFELKKRLNMVEQELKQSEKRLQNPQRIDDAFMKIYREVNELRILRATIKSRIQAKNSNHNILVIEPVKLSNF